eukprot:GEZU01026981.1.p1 GENE.GEZU01026981.1~~GEZU01026981.1.p1  ORF type:complete len:101 (+),score=7.89 GEZU01026981.1:22-303(+)
MLGKEIFKSGRPLLQATRRCYASQNKDRIVLTGRPGMLLLGAGVFVGGILYMMAKSSKTPGTRGLGPGASRGPAAGASDPVMDDPKAQRYKNK